MANGVVGKKRQEEYGRRGEDSSLQRSMSSAVPCNCTPRLRLYSRPDQISFGSMQRNAGLMNTRTAKSEWDRTVQQRKEKSGTVQPAVRSA